MATHFSILAWRIPWKEEPVGYSPWGCKESDTTEVTEHAHTMEGNIIRDSENQTLCRQGWRDVCICP